MVLALQVIIPSLDLEFISPDYHRACTIVIVSVYLCAVFFCTFVVLPQFISLGVSATMSYRFESVAPISGGYRWHELRSNAVVSEPLHFIIVVQITFSDSDGVLNYSLRRTSCITISTCRCSISLSAQLTRFPVCI